VWVQLSLGGGRFMKCVDLGGEGKEVRLKSRTCLGGLGRGGEGLPDKPLIDCVLSVSWKGGSRPN